MMMQAHICKAYDYKKAWDYKYIKKKCLGKKFNKALR